MLSKVRSVNAGEVTESLADDEIAMTIDPTAYRLIMDRLTDLYPNPVLSTVRETVSNAIDTSVRIPVERRGPVRISLPHEDDESPVFVVADDGEGMNLEDIKRSCASYGGSTKQTDFTQVGAYGLGFKAPISYTNSFDVETTKDGVTIAFQMIRKDIGNTLKILSTTNTGRPNGTTVTVPVRHSDILAFCDATQGFLFVPDVKLIVDGVELTGDKFISLGEVEISDGVTGRVWTVLDNFRNLYRVNAPGDSSELHTSAVDIDFILSGWRYRNPLVSSYSRSSEHIRLYVELKPGVVDFSSSRDEITKNVRIENLFRSLVSQLVNDSTRLRHVVIEAAAKMNREEYMTFVSRVFNLSLPAQSNNLLLSESEIFAFYKDAELSGRFKPIQSSMYELNSTSKDSFKLSEVVDNSGFGIGKFISELKSSVTYFGSANFTSIQPKAKWFLADNRQADKAAAIGGTAYSNFKPTFARAIYNSIIKSEDKRFRSIIVTGSEDGKLLSRTFSSRKILLDTYQNDSRLAFYFTKQAPSTEELNTIAAFSGREFEVTSLSEVASALKETRRVANLRRREEAIANGEIVERRKTDDDELNVSPTRFFNTFSTFSFSKIQKPEEKVSLFGLMSANEIIVFNASDSSTVYLSGLISHFGSMAGRTVFILNKVSASQAKHLSGYHNFFVYNVEEPYGRKKMSKKVEELVSEATARGHEITRLTSEKSFCFEEFSLSKEEAITSIVISYYRFVQQNSENGFSTNWVPQNALKSLVKNGIIRNVVANVMDNCAYELAAINRDILNSFELDEAVRSVLSEDEMRQVVGHLFSFYGAGNEASTEYSILKLVNSLSENNEIAASIKEIMRKRQKSLTTQVILPSGTFQDWTKGFSNILNN